MNYLRHDNFELTLPMPLLLIVEDGGWWQGENGSIRQEPFRTGMKRRHCLADYQALATLAAKLKMRILVAMVMCEWDRKDILRRLPSATWQGAEWNNQRNRGPWLDETAAFLKQQRDHLELGLHGVGHEYWREGILERSEFHDTRGIMRPQNVVKRHLEAFGELLEQNGLGSFPQTFVPPALQHGFGNAGESFQALANRFNIRYGAVNFARARQWSPPQHETIAWEAGVLMLDLPKTKIPWNLVGASPPAALKGPLLGIHWPNILHLDPRRNLEIVEVWRERLQAWGEDFFHLLAPDSTACWQQYCFQKLARIHRYQTGVELDLNRVPQFGNQERRIFLKIRTREPRRWRLQGANLRERYQQTPTVELLTIVPEQTALRIFIKPLP